MLIVLYSDLEEIIVPFWNLMCGASMPQKLLFLPHNMYPWFLANKTIITLTESALSILLRINVFNLILPCKFG